mmetsp:Transcript_31896/g.83424  ORF Transcript_31896/g.83424 Transcript_31896/m.83424 type:complete len:227 (-) Transcript_31896:725-1405(-)
MILAFVLLLEQFERLSIPLACSDPTVPPEQKPFECKNLESVDPTDVVNKITLEVDSNYSGYAMCNIGNASGLDPLGRQCGVGEYCCYCSDPSVWDRSAPCNATVGRANLFTKFGYYANQSKPCFTDYECWADRCGFKLLSPDDPGLWYSPLDYGYCADHPFSPSNCEPSNGASSPWKRLSQRETSFLCSRRHVARTLCRQDCQLLLPHCVLLRGHPGGIARLLCKL